MSFKGIMGQETAIEFLRSSIANNKVSHAYIFAGQAGVGKKLAAVNFAKALNCLAPDGNDSCDNCVQCGKIDAKNHPDVSVYSPEKENGSFAIETVRAITKDISLKPYEARKKVYILDYADSMTHQAANALLKTLEEPQSDSVLILVAENINCLLPTIRSRAKLVRFFPIGPGAIKKFLIDSRKIDAARAELLSRISAGGLGMAVKYDDIRFLDKRERVIKAVLDQGSLESDFDVLPRAELKTVLDIMLTWYRDILISKVGRDAALEIVNADRQSLIDVQAKKSSLEFLYNAIEQIILTGSLLERNANAKISMGVLGINLTQH